MKSHIRPALTIFILQVILTGFLYPLAMTTIAQMVFPAQADGSIINWHSVPGGSTLIGQDFTDPTYFWGRPSSTASLPYDAFNPVSMTASSGSNLGPLSLALVDAVRKRVEVLQTADPGNTLPIPVDLVSASASGLDPDISVAAACYQVPRVARLRGISEAAVRNLVDQYTTGRQFGVLGEPRVNVLLLNLALNEVK